MFPFLETIKVQNGKAALLSYHQKRLNRTFKHFFPSEKKLDLENIFSKEEKILATQNTDNQVFKCRFLYNEKSFFIELLPYSIKPISSFRLVHVGDDFSYHFKFSKRDLLNDLIVDNQEVIIVKNGFLTDTTYANIALKQGDKWYTPSEPLLQGTKRDFLIENQLIIPKPLHINDLQNFSHIKIFNAMMESEAIALFDCLIVQTEIVPKKDRNTD